MYSSTFISQNVRANIFYNTPRFHRLSIERARAFDFRDAGARLVVVVACFDARNFYNLRMNENETVTARASMFGINPVDFCVSFLDK